MTLKDVFGDSSASNNVTPLPNAAALVDECVRLACAAVYVLLAHVRLAMTTASPEQRVVLRDEFDTDLESVLDVTLVHQHIFLFLIVFSLVHSDVNVRLPGYLPNINPTLLSSKPALNLFLCFSMRNKQNIKIENV